MRLRFRSIPGILVEILQLAGVVEPGARHLRREIEVDRLRHAALELPERIARVLPDPGGCNHSLAVLAYALGRGLLVGILDTLLGVIGEHRLVAGKHEDGRASRVGGSDRVDHVGEPGPLRSRSGRNLACRPAKCVGGVAQRSFVAPAVRRNAGVGYRVHDVVIAGATKQRLDPLLMARASEHLRADHGEVDRGQAGPLGRLELGGDRNRRVGLLSGGRDSGRSKRGGGPGTEHGFLHESAA